MGVGPYMSRDGGGVISLLALPKKIPLPFGRALHIRQWYLLVQQISRMLLISK